jgi:16S rRNA (guanine527-N7)-methyltransferase
VLALLAPETIWTLVESNGKKARFLEHAVRRLGLPERVSVYRGRLEGYRPASKLDIVTARALADLATLAAWAAPLLTARGRLLALKGRPAPIKAEAAALGEGWHVAVTPVKVPGLAGARHIVVLEREH